MALTFPRSDFHTLAPLADTHFQLQQRVETSRSASGVTRVREVGPALWVAECTTVPLRHADAARVEALLDTLDGGARAVLLTDVRHPRPATATDEPLTGVQIHSVDLADGTLRLKGLPAGFVLTPGDYLAFNFGAGPSRALHRVVEGVTADGSGVTPAFAVRPYPRVGTSVDAAVSLRDPAGLFALVPDSVRVSAVQTVARQISFQAVQVLDAVGLLLLQTDTPLSVEAGGFVSLAG